MSRSKNFRKFDRVMTQNLRLEDSFFKAVGLAPSLPGAWKSGPMAATANRLVKTTEWMAWTKADDMARQTLRPLEHLVLINAFLDEGFQKSLELTEEEYYDKFPTSVMNAALQAQRACLDLAIRQTARSVVFATQERRQLAVSTCLAGQLGKGLTDRLLRAPMVSLEEPDLFSGVYEAASEEIATNVAQQQTLSLAEVNPVHYVQKTFAKVAQAPPKRSAAGGGKVPGQPASKKPRTQPSKSLKKLQKEAQALERQRTAVLAKIEAKRGPQSEGAPPPQGGTSFRRGGGGGGGRPFRGRNRGLNRGQGGYRGGGGQHGQGGGAAPYGKPNRPSWGKR